MTGGFILGCNKGGTFSFMDNKEETCFKHNKGWI